MLQEQKIKDIIDREGGEVETIGYGDCYISKQPYPLATEGNNYSRLYVHRVIVYEENSNKISYLKYEIQIGTTAGIFSQNKILLFQQQLNYAIKLMQEINVALEAIPESEKIAEFSAIQRSLKYVRTN